MPQENIHIIGQGTYGCVYRPNIDCKTKQIGSNEYLSKMQRKDKTSKNEIIIGKIITSLPEQIYNNRFAPILESCPIEIGKMEEGKYSTCKMIVQGKDKIKKTKIHNGKGQSFWAQTNGAENIKTFSNLSGKKATMVVPEKRSDAYKAFSKKLKNRFWAILYNDSNARLPKND